MTVLAGLPGAGKSTWAARNAGEALVVTGDDIRTGGADPNAVFHRMREQARKALAEGRDVIVDACSLRKTDRSVWKSIASAVGASTELVVMRTPLSTCRIRDAARSHPAGIDWARAFENLNELYRIAPREGWGRVRLV